MINEYKQCIIVRLDLKLSIGKLAAQVAHGSVNALNVASQNERYLWNKNGQKTVVLKVNKLSELLYLKKKAEDELLPVSLIIDEGRTEVEKGTITVLGIGPAESSKIDIITKDLKLL